MATPLADAAHEKLVVEALQSKEWREERSATADGGVKVWYWLRKDKKVKKASRRDLGAYLAKLAAEDAVPPAAAAAAAAGGGTPAAAGAAAPSKPAAGGGGGAPAGTAAPATTAPAAVENPDAAKIASMGLLGTDLESMTDAAVCRVPPPPPLFACATTFRSQHRISAIKSGCGRRSTVCCSMRTSVCSWATALQGNPPQASSYLQTCS